MYSSRNVEDAMKTEMLEYSLLILVLTQAATCLTLVMTAIG